MFFLNHQKKTTFIEELIFNQYYDCSSLDSRIKVTSSGIKYSMRAFIHDQCFWLGMALSLSLPKRKAIKLDICQVLKASSIYDLFIREVLKDCSLIFSDHFLFPWYKYLLPVLSFCSPGLSLFVWTLQRSFNVTLSRYFSIFSLFQTVVSMNEPR